MNGSSETSIPSNSSSFATFASWSGYTLGAALTASSGRVVVWADEWITYDAVWGDSTEQAYTFWNNVLVWLAGPSCTSSFPSVFPDPNTWYKICTSANTSQCLDVSGGNYSNGDAIQLWTKTNVNQEFQFKDAGNGYYTITCRGNTSYSIDMSGNFANSQTLKLWSTDVTNANQKFKPIALPGGNYRLESSNSSYSIDDTGKHKLTARSHTSGPLTATMATSNG